ncbi:DUF72 domain-containing protein [Microvirga aerophila]|uniref:DUF72 domain-containing protein n=1 Tax=Microvirga aerophila TaxID=670291 RepID=UPI000DEF7709|nr:DUF72 domain-containing protein [Microvirga aerophila]
MSKSRAQTQPQRSIARSAAQGPSRSLSVADIEPQETRQVRIGTSGWHYKSWHGPFYPSTLRIKDFLSFYVGEFDTAEINNSFYRLPTEQAVRSWRDGAPEGFLFAWKVSRFITHMKRLRDIEDSIDLVFGRMAGLGEKFGPVLFQLPPTFKVTDENRERLARTLSLVPPQHRYAFEFRHPGWYADDIFDLLRDHNAALCISDHADAPVPFVATADFAYIRAHGANGRYAGSYSRDTLQGWAGQIARWIEEKRDAYVYFDNDIKSAAPGDARQLLKLIKTPEPSTDP